MHIIEARRRAAKKKKLKKLGKSKSTDTEEEEQEDEMGDDGELVYNVHTYIYIIPRERCVTASVLTIYMILSVACCTLT